MNRKATNPRGYRQLLYAKYVTGKTQRQTTSYEQAVYVKWAKAAEGRFKGWLPADLNAAILDVGCGHGNFLFMLEQLGYRNLVGVDWSSEQLEQAAAICQHARLVPDDTLHYLRESNETFDLISCLNVIEHLAKDEIIGFLDLIRSHLKPGGRLLIETPNAASPWFGAVAYGDLTHEWFFTPKSLADTLLLSGFTHYEARSIMHFARLNARTALRLIAWKAISAMLALWNRVETGGTGGGIYTRVFVATATKP